MSCTLWLVTPVVHTVCWLPRQPTWTRCLRRPGSWGGLTQPSIVWSTWASASSLGKTSQFSVCLFVCFLVCLCAFIALTFVFCFPDEGFLWLCSCCCCNLCPPTCLFACLFACLPACLSVHSSICLPVCPFIRLHACLSAVSACLSAHCLFSCLSVLSACVPICPFVCLSVCSVCLSICLSVCLPACPLCLPVCEWLCVCVRFALHLRYIVNNNVLFLYIYIYFS